MINRISRTVTNREGTFVSNQLPPAIQEFTPAALPPDAEAVRRIMRLDVTTSDLAVVGVLQAIDACPFIRSQWKDDQRFYNLAFPPPPVSTTNGTLVNADDTVPVVRLPGDQWPAPELLELAARSGEQALLTHGKRSELVATAATVDYVDVNWPAWCGIRGRIKPENLWITGSRFTIVSWPSAFPYAALRDLLDTSAEFRRIVEPADLLTAFRRAESPMEAIAVAALALAKQHPLFNA